MPIKTTVVGSFPPPRWFDGQSGRLALRDAIMVVLKSQELAGIDLVSDGELHRYNPDRPESSGIFEYFAARMAGVRTSLSVTDLQRLRLDPAAAAQSRLTGMVAGEIGEGTLNLPAEYYFSRGLTRLPVKFACLGPHLLVKMLTDRHYGSLFGMAMAISRALRQQVELIDADVVQLNEGEIDPNPEETEWAVKAVNHVLEGIRGKKAVHICVGGRQAQPPAPGVWKDIVTFANGLRADYLLVEMARWGGAALAAFRELDSRIRLGLGILDVRDCAVETAELVARRIEEAAGILGPDRIQFVHPDRGLRMLPRAVAEEKLRAMVEGRNLFEGRK